MSIGKTRFEIYCSRCNAALTDTAKDFLKCGECRRWFCQDCVIPYKEVTMCSICWGAIKEEK